MDEARERIRKAAKELERALTNGAKRYEVTSEAIDVTKLGDEERRYAYIVRVEEKSSVFIAH